MGRCSAHGPRDRKPRNPILTSRYGVWCLVRRASGSGLDDARQRHVRILSRAAARERTPPLGAHSSRSRIHGGMFLIVSILQVEVQRSILQLRTKDGRGPFFPTLVSNPSTFPKGG